MRRTSYLRLLSWAIAACSTFNASKGIAGNLVESPDKKVSIEIRRGGNIVAHLMTNAGLVEQKVHLTDTVGRLVSRHSVHCDTIFQFSTLSTDKPVYLILFSFKLGSHQLHFDLEAMTLEGSALRPTPIFSHLFDRPAPVTEETSFLAFAYHVPTFDPRIRVEFDSTFRILLSPVVDGSNHATLESYRWTVEDDKLYQVDRSYHPEPGNSLRDIQNAIAAADSMITKFYGLRDKSGYDDSLSNASAWLSDYLKVTLPRVPESLVADLNPSSYLWVSYRDRLAHSIPFIHLASSADHKMRIWTWNTWTGGSMPFYESLVEYQSKEGIKVVDLERDQDWGPRIRGAATLFDTVYQVADHEGTPIYLPCGVYISDHRHAGKSITAFRIDQNALNLEIPIFPPETANVGWQVDLSAGCQDCEIPDMHFSDDTLYVQATDASEDHPEALAPNLNAYQFDGEHFVLKPAGSR